MTVNAGATTGTLTLTGQQNLLDTADGVVTARIKGTGYAIGTPGSATVTITDDDRLPGAPTALRIDQAAEYVDEPGREALLSWTAPADPGTSTIDRYHVEWSESSTFAGSPGSDTSTTASLLVTGLKPNTRHYIRVRAESAAGLGPWLTHGGFFTQQATPLAPIVTLTTDLLPASATPASTITVTWTAPTDDGASAILRYNVRWRPAGTTAWTDVSRADSDPLTEEINYSGPAVSVQVEVRAVNAVGDGVWASRTATFCRGSIVFKDCRVLLLARDTLVGTGGGVNWAAGTPVGRWTGVTVNSAGRVTRIDLEGLDTNSIRLKGTIPPILGQLDALERLFLGDGVIGTQDDPGPFLTGSIPAELGNLSNLKRLAITGNKFTGTSIPAELGNLRSLTYLLLTQNELTGSIPEELGNLSNLTSLYMGNNELTGSIPEELGNLSNLIVLHLSPNRLTGGIPEELGSLTSLLHLVLAQNPNLGGTIPEELGNLTRLTQIAAGGDRRDRQHTLPAGQSHQPAGLHTS